MSRRIRWWSIALFCSLLIAIAWLRSSRADSGRIAAAPELPTPVSIGTVQRRDLDVTADAVGRAEAKTSVLVTSRVDGQVAEVDFKEGRPVHRGQLLVRMDSAALDAQRRQAEGVVARDQAQLARLSADFDRNKALSAQGFISPGGLSQSESDLKATQATLKSDEAALDDARLQVEFTRIVAPIDGVAGALQLPRGGGAKANTTTLLVINQVDPVYVTFSLPEGELAPLKQALARGEVPVSAAIEGLAAPIAGRVAFVDNAVDAATGAITVKAIFSNSAGLVTPGQFARVNVRVGGLSGVLCVPSSAVENGVDGTYLFVVKPDSTVGIRKVEVGVEAAGYRVVRSGVAAGERVVTQGQARLHNQARVTIQDAPASASAAGAR
jgi:multidrug efflux system membrane fusion protein